MGSAFCQKKVKSPLSCKETGLTHESHMWSESHVTGSSHGGLNGSHGTAQSPVVLGNASAKGVSALEGGPFGPRWGTPMAAGTSELSSGVQCLARIHLCLPGWGVLPAEKCAKARFCDVFATKANQKHGFRCIAPHGESLVESHVLFQSHVTGSSPQSSVGLDQSHMTRTGRGASFPKCGFEVQ